MDPISIIIGASVGLIAGALIVFILQKSVLKGKAQAIVKEAEAEGETIKKDKILQAKEKLMRIYALDSP